MAYGYSPSIKTKFACSMLYTAVFISLMTWVPIIWIIVINVRRLNVSDYIRYHCYQAMLFNMIAFFVPQLFNLLIEFLINIVNLIGVFGSATASLSIASNWIIHVYFMFIRVIAVYAIIWTARGRFTYMPPISQAVNMLLR